jgi:hypothetical protein
MKTLPALAVWAVMLAIVAPLGCSSAADEAAEQQAAIDASAIAVGRVRFIPGFEPGAIQAQSNGKPMLVFFTTAASRHCQQMADEAFIHEQVVGLSEQFVCIIVDADVEADICREFGVDNYPTIQFISPGGVLLNRIKGKKPAPAVAQEMQAALQAVARRAATSTIR